MYKKIVQSSCFGLYICVVVKKLPFSTFLRVSLKTTLDKEKTGRKYHGNIQFSAVLNYKCKKIKPVFLSKHRLSLWWSIGDSNPWPPHCQCDALPTALMPHILHIKLYHIHIYLSSKNLKYRTNLSKTVCAIFIVSYSIL